MSDSKDYEYDLIPTFDPDEYDSDEGQFQMFYEEDRMWVLLKYSFLV